MAADAMAQALEQLVEASRAPLAEWGARYPGHRPVGTLCSYVPEEIIHAADLTPVRVRGSNAPVRSADAHLQSFACALCRSSLDQALSGALAPMAGAVFCHTCDAMQALADLWRINTPAAHFVDVVMVPANLSNPAARPYLVAELGRFRERLAGFVGRAIEEDELRSSIALYDETRRLVQGLQAVRDRLSAPRFFAVLDAAQAMPREILNPLLAELLGELAGAPAVTGGPRLFLSGATLDEPQVPELIEGLGAQVAGDDLCSGSRHFQGQVGAEGKPLENLADYALRRRPCPTKLQAGHDPGQSAVDQAREAQADGIVFVIEKFCEPHAFDYALARPALERAGLPHLVLEMEQVTSVEGLRTRLQAFVEML
jgi:benzoyl-CoA reductase/2-hydroxyglutaryl-CoA dehydratase subunit BcrC/BadD/HgdB